MSVYFNVAMLQLSCGLDDPDTEARKAAQLAKIDRLFDKVLGISPTADLFVLPETAVSGYDREHWEEVAEPIPGPISDHFCRKARELGRWICPGSIVERCVGGAPVVSSDGGGIRNTCLLISPAGEIVLRSSKRFVPFPFEKSVRGTDFSVAGIPGVGKVGLMNCADTAIPEIARNLAFNGAEIIINSLCQGPFIGGIRHRAPVSQVRAMENQCYIVAVNQAAPEGGGHSVTCDPEGRILEELEESESFALVCLDLEEVRRVRTSGSFAIGVKFLGLTRDLQMNGVELDACYRRGLQNAPAFDPNEGGQ